MNRLDRLELSILSVASVVFANKQKKERDNHAIVLKAWETRKRGKERAAAALKRGAEIEATVGKLRYKFDTMNAFRTKRGEFTDERLALHKEIVDSYLEQAKGVPQNREVLVMGGLPGAGKTTARKELKFDGVAIDPDEIKSVLLNNSPIPDGMKKWECAALVHEESAIVATKVVKAMAKSGANTVVDITMNDAWSVDMRLKHFDAAGYTASAAFVDVSVETSKKRIMGRFEREMDLPEGGRYIPPGILSGQRPFKDSGVKSKNRAVYNQMTQQGRFPGGTKLFEGE